jgi:hypothetical protein
LARGRGGAFDGLTGVRLTSKALRDSNVFWVLTMKGKNIPGFKAWLEAQQVVTPNPNAKNPKTEDTAPRTRNLAPSTYMYIKPSELKVEQKTPTATATNRTSGRNKISSQASATDNSFRLDDRIVTILTETIRDAGIIGSIRTRNLEEFDTRSRELDMTWPEIIDYVDFKVWEISELRGETYTASTVVSILTSDLIHHKAVTSNLEYLKRCEIRRSYREEAEKIADSGEQNFDEITVESSMSSIVESETVVQESVDLQPWQMKLKNAVSSKAWQEFLSKLQCPGVETKTLVIKKDSFLATWIADQYGAVLFDVLGTTVLRLESDDDQGFEIELSRPAPSEPTVTVDTPEPTPVEKPEVSEPVVAQWQQKLKAAVPGLAWRMFLSRLEASSSNPDAGRTRLMVRNEPFVAQWISDKYGKTIANTLGEVVLECSESGKVWGLHPER